MTCENIIKMLEVCSKNTSGLTQEGHVKTKFMSLNMQK